MNILVEFWFIILYSFFLSRSIITRKGTNECNSDNKIILASDKANTDTKRQLESTQKFLLCSRLSARDKVFNRPEFSRDKGNRNGLVAGKSWNWNSPPGKEKKLAEWRNEGRGGKWDMRCLRVIYRVCDKWGECRCKMDN